MTREFFNTLLERRPRECRVRQTRVNRVGPVAPLFHRKAHSVQLRLASPPLFDCGPGVFGASGDRNVRGDHRPPCLERVGRVPRGDGLRTSEAAVEQQLGQFTADARTPSKVLQCSDVQSEVSIDEG